MTRARIINEKFCEAANGELFSDIMAAITSLTAQTLYHANTDDEDLDKAMAIMERQIRRGLAEMREDDVAKSRLCG